MSKTAEDFFRERSKDSCQAIVRRLMDEIYVHLYDRIDNYPAAREIRYSHPLIKTYSVCIGIMEWMQSDGLDYSIDRDTGSVTFYSPFWRNPNKGEVGSQQ